MEKKSTLFVGDIEPSITYDSLLDFFSQFAPVRAIRLVNTTSDSNEDHNDTQLGNRKNFAFIDFYNVSDTVRLWTKFSQGFQFSLNGSPIRINFCYKKDSTMTDVGAHLMVYGFGKQGKNVSNIALVNAGYNCIEDMLLNVVNKFGKVLYIELSNQDENAFLIVMDSFSSADAVINALNNQYLLGKKLKIEYAKKLNSNQVHGDAFDREMELCILRGKNKY